MWNVNITIGLSRNSLYSAKTEQTNHIALSCVMISLPCAAIEVF